MYVWPCIICENDERYQLDATIVIHYHKYLYMFRASWRRAYRCPKHVDIFMIINHNYCIKLVPLVKVVPLVKLVPLVNFFLIIHNVTRLSWFTSYSDKSSSQNWQRNILSEYIVAWNVILWDPRPITSLCSCSFWTSITRQKACKRIYSISIHTIFYFFTISIPLQRDYNKSDTRIVPRDPAVYSLYNNVPTPSVQTSIKNRVPLLNRH